VPLGKAIFVIFFLKLIVEETAEKEVQDTSCGESGGVPQL
jgi:hypothetical protein